MLDGPGIESRWGRDFPAPIPGAQPVSCTMGTWPFPGVKSGRGVTLTPHPLLVPWSWKGRAIPLLPLWAVRPVQSLSKSTIDFIQQIILLFSEWTHLDLSTVWPAVKVWLFVVCLCIVLWPFCCVVRYRTEHITSYLVVTGTSVLPTFICQVNYTRCVNYMVICVPLI